MRHTNFEVGKLHGGYDSCYKQQFFEKRVPNLKHLGKADKNILESSHWDHSRSWS